MFAAILILFVFQSGCKKWLDVNYDPSQLNGKDATPDLLLAPLLESGASYPDDFEVVAMWMGYWCGPYFPPALNLTNYTNVESRGGVSSALPFLEEKSTALGQDYYLGIAKVLRAIGWSACVDKLNDVPYFQAYKIDILHPKYDDGKSIYEDLMKQLTQASALIKNADVSKNPKIAEVDIMFHGNKDKWLQFINSLKLRLLIHQANRTDRAAYIANEIQVIKAQGSGFLPMGVDAAVNPGYGVRTSVSPYYGLYSSSNTRGGSRGDISSGISSIDFAHANEYSMNLLKADNDPRLGYIYSTVDVVLPPNAPVPFVQPAPVDFRASRFGLPINTFQFPYENIRYISAVGGSRNTALVTKTSSGIIKGNDMDAWIMTSVENAFLQAEAIYRGWLPGDPEQAYKNALKESFRWLNVGEDKEKPELSDAKYEQWYASQGSNTRVNWGAAPDKYKLMMTQKYVALNGIAPFETWTDYRRNGRFPNLPVSSDPTRVGNTIPIRLVYTFDEIVTNAEEIKKLGPIDMFTGKIWWMP